MPLTPPCVLSIVIVSFNTRDLLRRCLASITGNEYYRVFQGEEGRDGKDGGEGGTSPSYPSSPSHSLLCEIVVVDNGSHDGSPEMVEREFPAVRLVRGGGNLGFARATNLGLAESRGDLLMLLNPDTEIVGNALAAMADFLSRHERAAAVGPALLYADGSPQHGAFHFPTLWMSFFDFFPINHRLLNSRLNGRYPFVAGDGPRPVDHPLGAAMMLKREALAEVGPLDESFFMYCEEVDWCLRAKRLGWQIYQLPAARIIHHAGQSAKQMPDEMLVQLHRSRYHLFQKHYPAGFVRAHRWITRMGLLGRAAEAGWEALLGRITWEQLRRRLQALRTIWSM